MDDDVVVESRSPSTVLDVSIHSRTRTHVHTHGHRSTPPVPPRLSPSPGPTLFFDLPSTFSPPRWWGPVLTLGIGKRR